MSDSLMIAIKWGEVMELDNFHLLGPATCFGLSNALILCGMVNSPPESVFHKPFYFVYAYRLGT